MGCLRLLDDNLAQGAAFRVRPPSVALVFGIGMNASSTRDVEFTSGYRHVNSGYAATLHVLWDFLWAMHTENEGFWGHRAPCGAPKSLLTKTDVIVALARHRRAKAALAAQGRLR